MKSLAMCALELFHAFTPDGFARMVRVFERTRDDYSYDDAAWQIFLDEYGFEIGTIGPGITHPVDVSWREFEAFCKSLEARA